MFILPVIIPPIIVATVWRNMFDQDNGAVNMILTAIGTLFKIPPDTFKIDWLGQVDDPFSFIPLPLAFFALDRGELLARLAAERRRRDRRAPEHPT